jgi:hypothetical protein
VESKRATEYAEKNRLWQERVGDWKRGGLTQTEYCRRNQLDPRKFLYWKKKILPKTGTSTLVELPAQIVKQSSAPQRSPQLILIVDERFKVQVSPGFDADTLSRLLGVLERS